MARVKNRCAGSRTMALKRELSSPLVRAHTSQTKTLEDESPNSLSGDRQADLG
jgi:hypothetical protein